MKGYRAKMPLVTVLDLGRFWCSSEHFKLGKNLQNIKQDVIEVGTVCGASPFPAACICTSMLLKTHLADSIASYQIELCKKL